MRTRHAKRRGCGRCVASALVVVVVLAHAGLARGDARSQALYARGLIPFHGGQWEDAYRLFDAATQADPQDAVALYYRGLAAARLGYTNVALQSVEAAVKLRPNLPGASLNLGILSYEAQQYDRAEPLLQRAYQDPNTRFSAALFLGLTRLRAGNLDGAREALAEAEKDPALRPTAQYYQALILQRNGETEAARSLFAQVQAERPDAEVGRVSAQYLAGAAPPAAAPETATAPAARPWSLWAYTRLAYNSNVVLGSTNTAIRKSRIAGGTDDGVFAIDLGGSYRLLDTEAAEFKVSYEFYQSTFFQITDFDLQSNRVRGDLSSKRLDAFSRPGLLQLGVSGWYDFYLLGFQSFAQEGLAIPYIRAFEGDTAVTQFFYRFRSREYMQDPFNPFLDNYNNAVGLEQYFLLGAPTRQLNLRYQYEIEDPLSDNGKPDFEYNANQIDLTLQAEIVDLTNLVASYVLRFENYANKNSRSDFTRRRHDVENQFLFRLARSLTPEWDVALTFLGTWDNSNIVNFQYNQYIVGGDLVLRF